jgi:hypothetical protein
LSISQETCILLNNNTEEVRISFDTKSNSIEINRKKIGSAKGSKIVFNSDDLIPETAYQVVESFCKAFNSVHGVMLGMPKEEIEFEFGDDDEEESV